jgi:glycosyltransferase involved in cell wall biosynthesis
LTELQAVDLRGKPFKGPPEKLIRTIPTCADYFEFSPEAGNVETIPEAIRERLKGKLVIGLVGSINASYRIAESLSLFDILRKHRPDSHLLCLTRQTANLQTLLLEHGIPDSAYTLATVRHEDMPEWLPQMHWGLLLLNTRFSKRGSMPTKLAEFFSSGVRPIQYGCNEEVSDNVRQAGSGIVLDSLSEEDLRAAALSVATTSLESSVTIKAREATRPHFSLEAGIKKYADLFDELLLLP